MSTVVNGYEIKNGILTRAEKTMQEQVKAPAKEFDKKPDKPCTNVWEFLGKDEVSLFNNSNYQVSVSIGLISLQIRPIVYIS